MGEDGESPGKLEVVEDERPKEPVEGWYITRAEIENYGSDLLKLDVTLEHTSGQSSDIEETLNPDIGDISECRLEEYGGEGKVQQSIVVIATGEDGEGDEFETNVQIEVDYETGEFKEDSLHGWERI